MRQKLAALPALAVALSGSVAVHAQSVPDLSTYDCAHVSDGTTGITSRHLAQVIGGVFNEWREYFTQSPPSRIVCIVQLRPLSTELDAGTAASFLKASAAIGAPGPERPQASSTTAEEPAEDVPAMPLRRVAPATPGVERSRAFDPNDFAPAMHRMDVTAAQSAPIAGTQSAAGGLERQQTIGVDDRTRVSTTTSNTYPYNTIGYLKVTFPSGNSFRCSATLVSAYVVLTAGHCVHNNNEGGYISSASFSPAQNETGFGAGILRPNGTKSDIQYVLTTTRWTQLSGPDSLPTNDYQYDLGALEFATPFSYTSTFMPVQFNDTASMGYSAGYPAVALNNSTNGMWQISAAETSDSTTFLRAQNVKAYAMDATGGQSGSPFWDTDGFGRTMIMGSLSYGDDLDDNAGGPWYGTSNQSLLTSWITWTPASGASAPVNSVSGLRVPAVYDTSQNSTLSFLRFYNSGTLAATVDVTLASYDDGHLLATWTSPSIPGQASLQVSIGTVESGATGGSLVKRGYYALSIRPHFSGFFQHVLWRPADGIIVNATACDSHLTADSATLINVHSSVLSGYQETVVVHNTSANATSATIGIYDAATGNRLGGYATGSIPANGEVVRAVAVMEAGAGFTPTSSQVHYVLKVETAFTGTVQVRLVNAAGAMVSDLTAVCALVAQ